MHKNDAELLIAVIGQLKRQQEINADKLDNQLGAIAGQLERIGNYMEFVWRGDHEIFKGQS